MKLRETLALPLSPAQTAAMYADPRYAEVRRDTLRANAASSEVSGDPSEAFTVTTSLEMPTDKVPDVVRPFVGSSVTVTERQEWQAPAEDGSRRGTMVLEVVGTPAGMTADLQMQGDAGSTKVEIDGDLRARIPLLGAKLEKAALPYVSTVLRAEEKAAMSYRRDLLV